jgi:hypothetical protein
LKISAYSFRAYVSASELMRARGLYARLYRLNYASFDDFPGAPLPSPADALK